MDAVSPPKFHTKRIFLFTNSMAKKRLSSPCMDKMGVVANFEFSAIDSFMLLAVANPNVGNEYERIHFTDFDASDTRI